MLILHFVGDAKGQTIKRIVLHEVSLRRHAIQTVVPKYPKEAIKSQASGIAVSEITITEDGSVIDIKIVESPHKSIDASMIQALKKWKFQNRTCSNCEYEHATPDDVSILSAEIIELEKT